MKTTFRYFISSILAFAMVFSTASFKLESHYCGDKLIDMAMFSSAESCEMSQQNNSETKGCQIKTGTCCSNNFSLFLGKNDLQKTEYQTISFNLDWELTLPTLSFNFPNLLVNRVDFSNYLPPPPRLSQLAIYKRFQSFLI